MKLGDWLDQEAASARLSASGMSAECADGAAVCFAKSAAAIERAGVAQSTPVIACWAPGRIEVLGKHTDYCGGDSVLAAVERGFCMLAAPRDDKAIRLLNVQANESCDFALDPGIEPPLGHWSNYPQTVARRVARNFPAAQRGATIAFASNLPPSSGMSSSSAFIVGMFLLLAEINDLQNDAAYKSSIHSAEELAGYLGTIENGGTFGTLAGVRGVGTFGGSEDHTAILRGRPSALVQYGYCPVRFKREITLSSEYVFAIASSGVVAEKTGAALEKYNRVSRLASAIVAAWQTATQSGPTVLSAIANESPTAVEKLSQLLSSHDDASFSRSELLERLDHFLIESRLIASVPASIDSSIGAEFGQIVHKSQDAGVRLLKNQTPETIYLADAATKYGAIAASAFGAGFGGSVWALVRSSAADSFIGKWKSDYEREFAGPAANAEFFLTRPGVPAFVLS